jgi:hypothetical protein
MKKVILISGLCLMASHFATAQQREFGWLIGTWKLKDKSVYETWTVAEDKKTLQGISFRIKDGDTTVMEKIRFTYDGNNYHYIPDVPQNAVPIDFKLTQHNSQGFVAENPQHDFPKLIRYKFLRKENGEYMEASIEGNGKVIPYYFEKVK